MRKLALVGMGCQTSVAAVAAARGARKLSGKVALTVGLLCSKTFSDEIFEELFEARYGVTRREIVKVNIKGRLQLWLERTASRTTSRCRSRRHGNGPAPAATTVPISEPSTPISRSAAS